MLLPTKYEGLSTVAFKVKCHVFFGSVSLTPLGHTSFELYCTKLILGKSCKPPQLLRRSQEVFLFPLFLDGWNNLIHTLSATSLSHLSFQLIPFNCPLKRFLIVFIIAQIAGKASSVNSYLNHENASLNSHAITSKGLLQSSCSKIKP